MPYKDKAKERLRQRIKNRKYYWSDPERQRNRVQTYRDLHPISKEHSAELARKTYLKHREDRIRKAIEYGIANRPSIYARQRVWREKNREKYLAAQRAYYWKNVERIRAGKQRREAVRRARKKGCSTDNTASAFYVFVRSKDRVPCYYCGKMITGKSAHIDHVIAISRQGNHASENLSASCSECNLKKNSKLPSEITFTQQPLLDL